MNTTECGFIGDGAANLLVMHGPTLLVDIGFDPAMTAGNRPALAKTALWALVDTGATESCIDDDLAQELGLPVVDKRTVGGVSGHHEACMYLAHIFIPTLNYTIHGQFAGVKLRAGGQRHFALIGRTFLHNFVMTYDGCSGKVSLVFAGKNINI